MTRARSALVSLAHTPWYHVVTRCVRRAFLCGWDHHTGRNFDHRRGWIVQRVKQLSGVFAVDVAAYAVMSNHYHLVVRIDVEGARRWSHEEVLRRWSLLFRSPPFMKEALAAQGCGDASAVGMALSARMEEQLHSFRDRLMDLSWFMRLLNEFIARRANAEDQVTGRFWEGRFKSQALLDESAILTAVVYVDLNPIRAGVVETPEESTDSSLVERIRALRETRSRNLEGLLPPWASPGLEGESGLQKPARGATNALDALKLKPLLPFDPTGRVPGAIPFALEDYLELVEVIGRCQHPAKRGKIPETTPRLLERLQLDVEEFVECSAKMQQCFGSAVGATQHLEAYRAARKVKFLRGVRIARRLGEKAKQG